MLRSLVIKSMLIAFACGLSFAAGAKADPPTDLHIPAGALVPALEALSRQTSIELVYQPQQLQPFATSGLSGSYTPQAAIRLLLKGTPLELRVDPSGAMAIVPIHRKLTSSAGAQESNTPKREPAGSFWERLRLAQADTGHAAASAGVGSAGPGAAVQADTPASLQEVVVTAQKREERLRDVPISISVLSGSNLDTSTSSGLSDALSRVPGVSVAYGAQGGATQITIRGVSAGNANFQGASAVGYYLDSAPFGFVKAAMAPDPDAYDLDRVEVLRGPQGTLYGASSLNGVVRVLTKDADLNEFDFKTRELGSTTDRGGGNYRADAAVNVPIVEGVLGARAVVGYDSLSGWIDTPNALHTNDAVRRTLRLKLNARPSDDLSLTFSTWDSRDNYGATNMADDRGVRGTTGREPISTDYDVYSLKAVYELPALTISSTSSYLSYGDSGILDLAEGGVPVSLFTQFASRMMSEELLVNSKLAGPWRWSAGAIYRDDRDLRFQNLPVLLPAAINVTDHSRSSAFFGEVTRLLFDGQLELTGGLRYFEDHVSVTENTPESGIANAPPHNGSGIFVATTPRVVLTWHPTPLISGYVSYGQGFRSGSPQAPEVLTAEPGFPSVKADKLSNYEAGVKQSLWSGRVDWEAAVYYIDWRRVQQALGIPIGGNVDLIALINAGTASGPGVDFSVTTRPVGGLELGLSFNWNDLSFNQAVYSSGALYAAAGDRLSYSPEFTVGGSAAYAFGLGFGGLTGRISVSANYESRQVFRYDAGGGAIVREPGDPITLARVAFAVEASGRWSVSAYADNINNESGAYVRRIYGFGEDWSSRPRPRTVGMQFDYHFRQ